MGKTSGLTDRGLIVAARMAGASKSKTAQISDVSPGCMSHSGEQTLLHISTHNFPEGIRGSKIIEE